MRALQIVSYGEIKDSLVFNELSKPAVQSNDVLIEVKAAAINPIDKSIILGNLQGLLPIPLPSTSAYDVSGNDIVRQQLTYQQSRYAGDFSTLAYEDNAGNSPFRIALGV